MQRNQNIARVREFAVDVVSEYCQTHHASKRPVRLDCYVEIVPEFANVPPVSIITHIDPGGKGG